MMRANLLPRLNRKLGGFGYEFDIEYLRETLLGLVTVLSIAAIGIGIETVRIHRIEAAAIDSETLLAARAADRNEARSLALAVARYQEIARETASVRRSGAAAERTIARIGNAVPSGVWLDSLSRDPSGFELTGGASTVDAIGVAILDFGRAFPSGRASLINMDNRDQGIRFTARIPEPELSAQR